MPTLEQLADLGTQATQRFDLRMPIHGSAASITQHTSFADRDACLAFAAAVRDASQLDTSAEITHLRDKVAELTAWKARQLENENERGMQEVAKLAGVPVGASCRNGITEFVSNAAATIAETRENLARAGWRPIDEWDRDGPDVILIGPDLLPRYSAQVASGLVFTHFILPPAKPDPFEEFVAIKGITDKETINFCEMAFRAGKEAQL